MNTALGVARVHKPPCDMHELCEKALGVARVHKPPCDIKAQYQGESSHEQSSEDWKGT